MDRKEPLFLPSEKMTLQKSIFLLIDVLIEKHSSPNELKDGRFYSVCTIDEQTANCHRQNTFLRHKYSHRTWGPGGLGNTGKQKTLICETFPKVSRANKTGAFSRTPAPLSQYVHINCKTKAENSAGVCDCFGGLLFVILLVSEGRDCTAAEGHYSSLLDSFKLN